jgi:cell volume regulation protein A
MLGMIELATHADASFWVVVREFAVAMSIGVALGLLGALVLIPLLRTLRLPSEGLYPVLALVLAGALYAVTSVAHGSGFLAVFIAGLSWEMRGRRTKARSNASRVRLPVLPSWWCSSRSG